MKKNGDAYRWNSVRELFRSRRLGLTTVTALTLAVSCGAFAFKLVSAHEEADVVLFSFQVGEQGTSSGYWRAGTEVFHTDAVDMVLVQIYVPVKFEEAIENTFANMEDYDEITGTKLTRLILVMEGSTSSSDCHPHLGRWHCHSN
jgi:hypothetical protein